MFKEFLGKDGTSDGAENRGGSKTNVSLCQIAHSKQNSTRVASITANANEPEILFCKTNFSNSCFPGIHTKWMALTLNYFLSLSLSRLLSAAPHLSVIMTLRILQLISAHACSITLAVNQGICSVGTSALPGSAPVARTQMRDVSFFFCFFFCLILWGFQQIFCLHACPGWHPPHPHHTCGYAQQTLWSE